MSPARQQARESQSVDCNKNSSLPPVASSSIAAHACRVLIILERMRLPQTLQWRAKKLLLNAVTSSGAAQMLMSQSHKLAAPSRTGPLTLRMISRSWSSRNFTRTCVTCSSPEEWCSGAERTYSPAGQQAIASLKLKRGSPQCWKSPGEKV